MKYHKARTGIKPSKKFRMYKTKVSGWKRTTKVRIRNIRTTNY